MLWDESDPVVGELLATELLQSRMDSWAAFIAIDEAYEDAHRDADPQLARFDAVVQSLLDALDRFDRVLQTGESLEILSVTTDTELLRNWRLLLADEYRECPPWWLDGTLEQIQEDLDRDFERTIPWKAPVIAMASAQLEQHHSAERLLRIPLYSLAGDTADDAIPFESLVWLSPERDVRATLIYPRRATESTMITLVFRRGGKAATEMAGTRVRLSGWKRRLTSKDGRAFRWSLFRSTSARVICR